ncbi:MAG TPA: hypothetical protein VF008_17375, partial [Niastella sp.]
GQYTDFLNALTHAQQAQRVATDISDSSVTNRYVMTNRPTLFEYNHIKCPAAISVTGPVIFSCGVPEKACNYLGWADYASYLDWAGLRPFSELEFEKLCRGFDALIDQQLIWGPAYTDSAVIKSIDVIDADLPTETNIWADPLINTYNRGNVSVNQIAMGGERLMRCGFPGSKPINRALSGAAYFGVMEMAGNAGEFVVMALNDGLLFTGENGNGDVTDIPASWPDITASGISTKGGNYKTFGVACMIYPRIVNTGTQFINNTRNPAQGGRGALSL